MTLGADRSMDVKDFKMYSEITDIKEKYIIKCDNVIYEVKFVNNVMNFNEFLQVDLELIDPLILLLQVIGLLMLVVLLINLRF
jgi:hypothetical protein